MKMAMLTAVLLLSACATGPWKDFYGETQSASISQDVRKFVTDVQGCGHFSGEEPYDAERAAFLKKAMDKMCPRLKERRAALLKRYPRDDAVKALIAESWAPFE